MMYLCIDLKSFYASVECVERKLNPFVADLVVADVTRGKGALCLAVSSHLKMQGVKNRCRLYEIDTSISYTIAKPRMNLYMQYAADIYEVYLKYVSKEDIHVYSIDEVFIDIKPYLHLYELTPKQLAIKMIADIYETCGIPATAGIGTNLYLAKVALDLLSKHNEDQIAYLDEYIYKEKLWNHTPITDFWHVGRGIANRLSKYHIYTMKQVALCDVTILKKEFGINGEYLYDHSWGKEPTTMADIKAYKPTHNSISNSQILFEDYDYENGLLILKEMIDINVLELVERKLVCSKIALHVGFSNHYKKSVNVSRKINYNTSSVSILMQEFVYLYEQHVSKDSKIRQIGISFGHIKEDIYEMYDLFSDTDKIEEEKNLSKTLVDIKNKYGKNAVLKGMNLLEKATAKKRNTLVGGHNAK